MRIAFVGKGGSGKTTLAVLFAQYARTEGDRVVAIDADINRHMQDLLGITEQPSARFFLSHPETTADIRAYLKGDNERIKDVTSFCKTTPPGRGSRLIRLADPEDLFLSRHAIGSDALRFLAVGTYEEKDIGTSCYHTHLSVCENVLSHLVDDGGVAVVDMVAGVDAFANTLHAQFDLLALSVEPTRRSLEVYEQYRTLAMEAGVENMLYVIANKIRAAEDRALISSVVPTERILGFVEESEHLRRKDREGGALWVQDLESQTQEVLERTFDVLRRNKQDPRARLARLWDLHRAYVAQDHVRLKHGDLEAQIDPEMEL